jgi:hypothetical protein
MVRALHTSALSKAAPTSEQAREARARAWSYIFACYEKHKTEKSSGGEEQARREVEHVSRTHLAEYLQEQDYADAVQKLKAASRK